MAFDEGIDYTSFSNFVDGDTASDNALSSLGFMAGVFASRPAQGNKGAMYLATNGEAGSGGADFLYYDDGAAWQKVGSVVDLSGAVKGDLLGFTAAQTEGLLNVGADGQALVADSNASTGLNWKAPLGEFVAADNVENTTNSASFTQLANVGSISIAADKPIMFMAQWRKFDTGTSVPRAQVRINGSIIVDEWTLFTPGAADNVYGIIWGIISPRNSTNQAISMMVWSAWSDAPENATDTTMGFHVGGGFPTQTDPAIANISGAITTLSVYGRTTGANTDIGFTHLLVWAMSEA